MAGPVRTCVGCRQRFAQAQLRRVVADGAGGLIADRRAPGRGAWLCATPDCLRQAETRRAFARALRTHVEPASVRHLEVAFSIDGATTCETVRPQCGQR